jgi:hypothetical protein
VGEEESLANIVAKTIVGGRQDEEESSTMLARLMVMVTKMMAISPGP